MRERERDSASTTTKNWQKKENERRERKNGERERERKRTFYRIVDNGFLSVSTLFRSVRISMVSRALFSNRSKLHRTIRLNDHHAYMPISLYLRNADNNLYKFFLILWALRIWRHCHMLKRFKSNEKHIRSLSLSRKSLLSDLLFFHFSYLICHLIFMKCETETPNEWKRILEEIEIESEREKELTIKV